jgi:hypothetical protein
MASGVFAYEWAEKRGSMKRHVLRLVLEHNPKWTRLQSLLQEARELMRT